MKGRFIEIMQTLKSLNYNVKCKLMNTMWYEVPQSRKRLIWIGVRKDFDREPSYPEPLRKIITVREALKGIKNKGLIYSNTSPKFNQLVPLMKAGEQGTDLNGVTTGFQMIKLNPNKPCNTISKVCTGTWFSGIIHPYQDRLISINELKAFASFPEDFQLTGKFQEQWARIGNAVMPKFMYHIAKHIKKNILELVNA